MENISRCQTQKKHVAGKYAGRNWHETPALASGEKNVTTRKSGKYTGKRGKI